MVSCLRPATVLLHYINSGSILSAGFPLGTVLCLPIGGWLSSSHLGWASSFYLFGGLGVVWSVAWFALVHDRPEKHPRISQKELTHLQSFKGSTKRAEVSWDTFVHHPLHFCFCM